MPIVDSNPQPINTILDRPEKGFVTPGADDMADTPSLSSVGGATFRRENLLSSAASSAWLREWANPNSLDDPDFKPFDDIKGTPYEAHADSFLNVRNRAQQEAVKRDIDGEEADRKIVAAAPWYMSVPLSLLANVSDPSIFVPGGAFVRGAKGGFSLAKSAGMVGTGAGIGTAIQEAGLQATQQTRELSESVIDIGASTLLGGLLGAAGGKLLNQAEWKKSVSNLERELAGDARGTLPESIRAMEAQHIETEKVAKEVGEELAKLEAKVDGAPAPARDAAISESAAAQGSAAPASLGAAATSAPALADTAIAGKTAGWLAKWTQRLNPGLRLAHSESAEARSVAQNLAETSTYTAGNESGIASARAVETLRKRWNAGLETAIRDTRAAYKDYWKAGGRLTRSEFEEEAGKAMRRGDEHAIPEVAQVAQSWRKNVFDPLKDAAIEAKILKEDVSVTEAVSYFSRMWNPKKIKNDEVGFKSAVRDYYQKVIGKEYQQNTESINARFARLDQEIADLNLTTEARGKTLTDLDRAAQEHESQWPSLSAAADRLSEIRGERRAAIKAGDEATAAKLKEEAETIDKSFPEGSLKAFSATRTNLARRQRNVSLGVAGLEQRSERVLGQLADLEEANHRAMVRLVEKGQRLEKDLDRLDADALEKRISDIAESFSKVARKAEASVERAKREIENINKRAASAEAKVDAEKGVATAAADTKIKERITKEGERQHQLAARMDEIAARLEAARNFDHDGLMAEIKSAIDKATRETSAQSLARGERAARLGERMAQFDPARVKERVATIEAMKADIEKAFVDRWEVKRLGTGVDLNKAATPDFTDAANDIANHAYNTLTNRGVEGARSEFITIGTRGPMKERTFHIPDELVEKWLDSNIDMVGRRYNHVMSSDVELARKFGTADMKEALEKVSADYDKLRAGADPARQAALRDQETADLRDIRGMRDAMRGTSNSNPSYERIVRSANALQYVLKMGQVVLSSLTEPVRVVAAKGMVPFMKDAFNSLGNMDAHKLAMKEIHLAGNINDRILAARLSTLADITDYHGTRGPVEKFLDNMTKVASTWNGIRLWTDGVKMLAGTMIQNNILKNVSNFAAASAKDKRLLAFLGIDEGTAGRIAKQFADHGENIDGVHVAGTERWTDDVAREAYFAAVNKDLDSMVVTRGVGDVPLFGHTPVGRLLLQFNSFNLASHQRILLRGLQEGHARFLSGVVALSSMGMLQTYLAALAMNTTSKLPSMKDNPGWWISEGLDKSGMFMVPFQLANGLEKIAGINPIKTPIKLGDKTQTLSPKNRNRNELGAVAGPSGGTLQDIGTFASMLPTYLAGEEITKKQKNARDRLIPFNSYLGVRYMLKYIINPPHE